ncbi:hypothetical protein Q7P37_003599 [Cladosporium fusiforme]
MRAFLLSQAILASVLQNVHAAPAATHLAARAAWPDLPFQVSGRDIVSESGSKVVYAGVNWPGAADAMLPEGLQYNSIANIVGLIKSLDMNVVRLTFAIEMVDDIYSDSPDQTLEATLVKALGQENGTVILDQILEHNPELTAETTRLEVFDAVAAELAKQEIWVHLDNHISKAQWCCSADDGDAWFGDSNFDPAKWIRALGYMADHTKSWEGLTSIGLRNEFREPANDDTLPYTWNTWMDFNIPAAEAVHGNNSDALIFFSGLGYDTDNSYFIQNQTWNGVTFTPSSYPFREKIVYEIHNYQNGASSCDEIEPGLYNKAYCAMNLSDTACPNHAPTVLTEFGFDQTDGSFDEPYAKCIHSVVTKQPGGPGGWMQWVLAGSYYIRSGIQDYEETWGLLSHDWSGWRNQTVIDGFLKPLIQDTL